MFPPGRSSGAGLSNLAQRKKPEADIWKRGKKGIALMGGGGRRETSILLPNAHSEQFPGVLRVIASEVTLREITDMERLPQLSLKLSRSCTRVDAYCPLLGRKRSQVHILAGNWYRRKPVFALCLNGLSLLLYCAIERLQDRSSRGVQLAATSVFCAERTFQAPCRFSITCQR
jgi:hypothetical protein